MPETKINLNYQVNATQFDDKVGDAITSGGASDELDSKVNSKFNTVLSGSEYTGGHTHSGGYLDGEKISFNHLKDVPTVFPPAAHTHPFTEITGDISWAQIDDLVTSDPNDPNANEKLIAASDPRLSDTRDPNPHTHPFSDITGDIAWEQLDSLIATDSTPHRLIEATDARLSDAREPLVHDNTKHSEEYITAASVTYEVLNGNGDVGANPGQVADGPHVHDDIYYRKDVVDTLLDGKANLHHEHSDADIRAGALASDVSYATPQTRYFSFSPFGYGAWSILNGYAELNLSSTGGRSFLVPIALPDGAVIKGIYIYVKSDGAHALYAEFKSKILDGDLTTEVAIIASDDTLGDISEYSETNLNITVNNDEKHYFIEFEEDNSITDNITVQVHGIKIETEISKPLP